MEPRLKSILKPIPWSLVLKAGIFGLSWLILPVWAFWAVALYLYFSTFFQLVRFGWHFAALLFFMYVTSLDPRAAVFFAIVFYLLFGLKDLVFIDRRAASEALLYLYLFLFALQYYSMFETWAGTRAIVAALLFALFFFLIGRDMVRYSPNFGPAEVHTWHTAFFLLSFLLFEFWLGILFLPLSFPYHVAIFFLVSTFIVAAVLDYLFQTLTIRKILVSFSVFSIFIVGILAGVSWSL